MSNAELRTSLRYGLTLAQLAEAENVPVTTVTDALVAAAEERLARAVRNGRLTQAEADNRRQALRERITTLVNEGFPRGRHARPGQRGFERDRPEPGAPAAPETSRAPAPSPSPTS